MRPLVITFLFALSACTPSTGRSTECSEATTVTNDQVVVDDLTYEEWLGTVDGTYSDGTVTMTLADRREGNGRWI